MKIAFFQGFSGIIRIVKSPAEKAARLWKARLLFGKKLYSLPHIPEIIQLFVEESVNVYLLFGYIGQIKNQVVFVYQITISEGFEHIIFGYRNAFRLGFQDAAFVSQGGNKGNGSVRFPGLFIDP